MRVLYPHPPFGLVARLGGNTQEGEREESLGTEMISGYKDKGIGVSPER